MACSSQQWCRECGGGGSARQCNRKALASPPWGTARGGPRLHATQTAYQMCLLLLSMPRPASSAPTKGRARLASMRVGSAWHATDGARPPLGVTPYWVPVCNGACTDCAPGERVCRCMGVYATVRTYVNLTRIPKRDNCARMLHKRRQHSSMARTCACVLVLVNAAALVLVTARPGAQCHRRAVVRRLWVKYV